MFTFAYGSDLITIRLQRCNPILNVPSRNVAPRKYYVALMLRACAYAMCVRMCVRRRGWKGCHFFLFPDDVDESYC